MKCVSCKIEVSSNFVAAIVDNKCPACGGQLMDGSEYKKLFALRKQLTPLGLGLDDITLTKIAAAITSRFELWPRDSVEEKGLPTSIDIQQPRKTPVKKNTPIRPKSQQEAEKLVQSRMPQISFDEEEEYYPEENISSSETAALIKEFGLDKGDTSTSLAMLDDNPEGFKDPELMAAIGNYDFNMGDESEPSLGKDRLNRAKALKSTASNQFGIKPIKTHSGR